MKQRILNRAMVGYTMGCFLLVLNGIALVKQIFTVIWLPLNISAWLILFADISMLFLPIFIVGYVRTGKETFIEAAQVVFTLSLFSISATTLLLLGSL